MGGRQSAARDGAANCAAVDAMYSSYAEKAAEKGTPWPGIDARSILETTESETPWQDRFLFIDVRTQLERNVSHIPGALMPSEFAALLKCGAAGLHGKQPVAYCTIGYRSGEYCTTINGIARESEVEILNLKGSILAWIHAGG